MFTRHAKRYFSDGQIELPMPTQESPSQTLSIALFYESFTVSLCHFYVCSSPMESRRKAFNSVAWRSAVLTIRAGGYTHQGHTELGSDRPNLRVTVVATNDRGTLAALRTAGKLAANLRTRIALVKAQIVPFQFPLDKPPVSTDFLQRQLYGLVCEAGVDAEEITIHLWLCRDRNESLRRSEER